MTTWLKQADEASDWLNSPELTQKLKDIKRSNTREAEEAEEAEAEIIKQLSQAIDDMDFVIEHLGDAEGSRAKALEALTEAKAALSIKAEGLVYNDPEYQAETLNKGDMGAFDEQHVTHLPNTEVNPGPASTNQGSDAPNAPGRGLAEGLFD